MYLKTSFSVLFIFYYSFVFGQRISDIKFQSLSVSDGLPNNTINQISSDKYGFLWIATNEGLCRYDSPNNIKIFNNDQFGLQSNQIRSIWTGDDDNIWIGSRNGGLSKFNFITHNFTTYTYENGAISNNEIISLLKDENLQTWVGTEHGLNIYNPESNRWTKYLANLESQTALHSNSILSISMDRKKWKWIGTWGGGFYLVLNTKHKHEQRFRKFIPSTDPNSLNVWKVFEDSKGRYWIATHNGGLFLMQLPPGASNEYGEQDWEPILHNYSGTLKVSTDLTSNYIYDINEDANGNIWLACILGLNVIPNDQLLEIDRNQYSKEKPRIDFINILYEKNLKGSINHSDLNTIYRDGNDIMWFGSSRGLNLYSHKNSKFKRFDLDNFSESYKQSNVSAVTEDKHNNIWLTTETYGLLKLIPSQNRIIDIKNEINQNLPQNTYAMKIIGDSLLLGTRNGFGIYDFNKNIYKEYNLNNHLAKGFENTLIRKIFKDTKSRIWLGTERGLALYDKDNSFIDFFTTNPDDSLSISDSSITDIYEDSNKTIWIATYNGINRISEIGTQYFFTQLKVENNNPDYNITSNQVTSINEFEDLLYFGSQNGIFTYHKKLDKFEPLDKINKNNNISNIEITSKGELWAVNSDGICMYNTNSKYVTHFEKEKNLGDLADQLNSSFISSDDRLLLAMRNGYTYVGPDNLESNSDDFPVYITEAIMLSSEGEEVVNLIDNDHISISPNVYHLSFNYAALNYNYPKDNVYAYKLEGFNDGNWKYLNINSPIIFTNLDPGEYTLNVKAANNEGVWNEIGDSISINVIPAIYETFLFKLCSLFLFLSLIYFGFRYYTRNIIMRNEQLRQEISDRKVAEAALLERDIKMKVLLSELDKSNIDLERSNKDLEQFAYIASHDLKEPLRTIGTFTDLLKYKFEANLNDAGKKYIYFITDGVGRMSSLINSLLTYSRAGQESKDLEKVNLNDLITDILADFTIVVKEKNVAVKVEKLPTIYCNKDQMSMLFSNLILNGMKFNTSDQPRIEISSSQKEDYWQFSVQDNGIGIPKEYQEQIFEIFKRLHSKEEYEGTGIGLALCRRIVETHEGEIWLDSTPENGSEFHFTIAKVIDPIISDKRKHKKKKLKEEIESLLYN